MNWQKKLETEPSQLDRYQQIDEVLKLCNKSSRLCTETYKTVPDVSIAYLLFRICHSYEEIIQQLRGESWKLDTKEILEWESDQATRETDYAKHHAAMNQFLYFQQQLLPRLRHIIHLQSSRNEAYQLSGSVATLQILHDYLTQFHDRSY